MGEFERKSDERRIFNTEFKRQAVERTPSGDTTVAALSRELSIAPALNQRLNPEIGSIMSRRQLRQTRFSVSC